MTLIEEMKNEMLEHLKKMEHWQAVVDTADRDALHNAGNDLYKAKISLKDNFMYNRACGLRTGHQLATDTYALVVIALGTKEA